MFGFARQSSLNRLAERLEKVENDLRQANLDFDELYQKCRKLLGRTVKERASIDATTIKEGTEPENNGHNSPGRGSLLTPRQLELQQQILRRRAGGAQ